jgi:hypothetical protein
MAMLTLAVVRKSCILAVHLVKQGCIPNLHESHKQPRWPVPVQQPSIGIPRAIRYDSFQPTSDSRLTIMKQRYCDRPTSCVCCVKSTRMQAADASSQLNVHGGTFDRCLCMGICISNESRPLPCPLANEKED